MMRQIVLDTETTGLSPEKGHRVIEIGCIELINRQRTHNDKHYYLNPERACDEAAESVHGLTAAFLADKPVFESIYTELMDYLTGATLIIHNAAFDVGFLNAEILRIDPERHPIEHCCQVIDTLAIARAKHLGQKNSLDALCRRYNIDLSGRRYHGALLDAELLASVYLGMTGGQMDLFSAIEKDTQSEEAQKALAAQRRTVHSVICSAEDLQAHQAFLAVMSTQIEEGTCVWDNQVGGA